MIPTTFGGIGQGEGMGINWVRDSWITIICGFGHRTREMIVICRISDPDQV